MTARPRAAVDCGSNSTRLLVDDGAGRTLARVLTITRLAQDVDRTGRLADEALERTLETLARYREIWTDHGVTSDRVRIAATSAVRDAENAASFVEGARERTDVVPEVLSGDEEAACSFDGATHDLEADVVAVIDIGGGSTEVVVGRTGATPVGHSMQLGSVRLTERRLHDDPPTEAQVYEAREEVRRALDENAAVLADRGRDVADADVVVGVAGTVTTIAALVAGHGQWVDGAVHGAVLTRRQVADVTADLLGRSSADRASEVAIQPGREDVIHAGALVLDTFMEHHGVSEIRVSESDILDGLLRSI